MAELCSEPCLAPLLQHTLGEAPGVEAAAGGGGGGRTEIHISSQNRAIPGTGSRQTLLSPPGPPRKIKNLFPHHGKQGEAAPSLLGVPWLKQCNLGTCPRAPLRAAAAAGPKRAGSWSCGRGTGGDKGRVGGSRGQRCRRWGGHAPYLGVTVVISVVGCRMWQVVMVKVDGVWGRLLTERNTGRDRRHRVNGQEGGGKKIRKRGTCRGSEQGAGHAGAPRGASS